MKKAKTKIPESVRNTLDVISKILPKVPDVTMGEESFKFLTKVKDGMESLVIIDHPRELRIAYRANGWPEVRQYIRLIRAIENRFYGSKHHLIAGD